MVETYQCLYMVLHWNILVNYQRQISIQLHHHFNVMQCFILFIWRYQTLCCHYYWTHQAFDLIAQGKNLLTTSLGKIWENTDGCAEKYRCASSLYLMSFMSQCYSIIIDWGIGAPGYDKEVADGLNYVDKCYIYQFMSTVQLPGSNIFDSQMQVNIGNQNNDVSLVMEF